MNRDDIIRMAREVDLHERVKDGVGYVVRIPNLEKLERFAALVAAAEREQCAKLCEEMARRHNDIRRAALEVAAEWIRARGESK